MVFLYTISNLDEILFKAFKIFERKNLMIDICKEFRFKVKSEQIDATLAYLIYWHNKFDNKKINSLCVELKI